MREDTNPGQYSFLGNPVWCDDLFSGISEESAKARTEATRMISVPAGSTLFLRGKRAAAVFTLVSGEAELIVDTGRQDRLSRSVSCGEVFGLPEAVTGDLHGTTLTAVSDCVFESISADSFSSLLRSEPKLGLTLIKILGKNLNSGRRLLLSLS